MYQQLLDKTSKIDNRDGPKFGKRRSLAEEFGRMFGSATCDYSAEVRLNFGKNSASFVALPLRRFALASVAADVNLKSLYLL